MTLTNVLTKAPAVRTRLRFSATVIDKVLADGVLVTPQSNGIPQYSIWANALDAVKSGAYTGQNVVRFVYDGTDAMTKNDAGTYDWHRETDKVVRAAD